jgi:hypothetical protein
MISIDDLSKIEVRVGGWEQSKDQRERMPLRYWGFNPSQEKEIIRITNS